MSRRCLAAILAGVIVLGLAFAGAATAGQPAFFLRRPPAQPRFYPEYVIGYDTYGRQFGFGVPTYNWGYFGARHGPMCVRHTGYYGDYVQWSCRRGY